jgi:hypothetical protein
MAKVHVSRVIDFPVEKVWEYTKSFDAMKKWNSEIAELHIEGGKHANQIGCIRNFTLRNGANVRETLLAFDEIGRSLTYDIIISPMPIQNYVAIFTCRPITEGNKTLVEWSATFDVAKDKEQEITHHVGRNVFAGGIGAISDAMQKLG